MMNLTPSPRMASLCICAQYVAPAWPLTIEGQGCPCPVCRLPEVGWSHSIFSVERYISQIPVHTRRSFASEPSISTFWPYYGRTVLPPICPGNTDEW